MSSVLSVTSSLVDLYNGTVTGLGLGQFFRVDKGWKDIDDEV